MDDTLGRRMLGGAIALHVIVFVGTAGYYWLGDGAWTVTDCLYMTVITLSTVGYGEALDGMREVAYARLFTAGLIVLGIGVVVYFASNLTAFIIEGDLRRALTNTRMRKRMRRLEQHIIVCGTGSTGRHVIGELLAAGTPTVAIDIDPDVLEAVSREFPKAPLYRVTGDATDDDVLEEAQIARASGVVAALASDKDNLYLVMAARQANPSLRIVARCSELAAVPKLEKAGADTVISPNFIGGMRMVRELVEPAVVRFIDDLMGDDSEVQVEEVAIAAGSELVGRSLREAGLRERMRVSVLAVRHLEGTSYDYVLDAELGLTAGMTLVVLGARADVAALRRIARATSH